LRSELELGGRWSDADSISNSAATGDVRSISAMVNAYIDIDTNGSFTHYVGVGLGAAQIKANGLSPIASTSINDTDTTVAYQGIVGLSYRLSQDIALNADYRYFATQDLDFSTASSTSVNQQYTNHALMLGLTFKFGASTGGTTRNEASQPVTAVVVAPAVIATPSPPVQKAKPETQTAALDTTQRSIAPSMPTYPTAYRLLFDWNSAALNTQGMAVVQLAAHNALKIDDGKVIRILVSGHADRSGTMKNNLRLSKVRAEKARDALIAQGLTGAWITTEWYGEKQPILETKDGVRASQNRRVEIIFKP
jgi:outer membrane protein OmpA-like peptidoglycan-associated protein